jgi:predicted DNA-binding protein
MKTAISVPDETYDRAERAARKHGMNRSQFYVTAAERYVAELESADLTDAIDAVVEAANSDNSGRFAVAASGQLLDGTDDEW